MIILVQNRLTKLFCLEDGQWTGTRETAMIFLSPVLALNKCLAQTFLCDIVLAYPDPETDLVIPCPE